MRTCPQCSRAFPDDTDFCPKDGNALPPPSGFTEEWLSSGLSRRYRIVKKLGAGGMGSVFLAEQIALGNRPVALKVLSRRLLDDPEFLKRFHQEGASTARIRHVNVVTIYESGQADDGTPYIAMELLEGESLRDAISRRGPLPAAECAEILQEVARGLNAAHKLGIIHRDLKPDNIFLARDSEGDLVVKVVDFGIAKMREAASNTMTGMVLGTPAYMSCEQASGTRSDDLDGRSDLYSLGVVAYEMLAGRTPFHSDTPLGYVRKHMLDSPPPLSVAAPSVSVPPQVELVVMKALAKDREQRYPGVLDFANAFARAATEVYESRREGAPTFSAPAPSSVRASAAELAPTARPSVSPHSAPRLSPLTSAASSQGDVAVQTPPPMESVRPSPRTPAGAEVTRTPAPQRPAPPQFRVIENKPSFRLGIWIFVLIAAVIGGVALVWYKWPQTPVSPPQQTTAPAISTPISNPNPPSTQPVVSAPRPVPQAANPVRTVNPAEIRNKVNAAISEGDTDYDDGKYDAAIAAYESGLKIDPGNTLLRERIEKVTAAKAVDNSVPR